MLEREWIKIDQSREALRRASREARRAGRDTQAEAALKQLRYTNTRCSEILTQLRNLYGPVASPEANPSEADAPLKNDPSS